MFTNCNVSLTVHQKYGQFSIQISNGLSYYLKTGHNGRVYYLLNFGHNLELRKKLTTVMIFRRLGSILDAIIQNFDLKVKFLKQVIP